MILTCPNCGTQYVVKDGAIPPQGRQVRCASCKHSWHQDAEPASELQMGPEMQPAETAAEDETFTEATLIDPSTGPEAEERAYEEAVIGESVADGSKCRIMAVGSTPRPALTTISAPSPIATTSKPGGVVH
jgi:predicted Zn finger-like uncharacterized protein